MSTSFTKEFREDVLWTLGIADRIKCIYQGIFVTRLERKVKVDGDARRRVVESLPIERNGIPGVLNTCVVPR